jgi:hypothetical protein
MDTTPPTTPIKKSKKRRERFVDVDILQKKVKDFSTGLQELFLDSHNKFVSINEKMIDKNIFTKVQAEIIEQHFFDLYKHKDKKINGLYNLFLTRYSMRQFTLVGFQELLLKVGYLEKENEFFFELDSSAIFGYDIFNASSSSNNFNQDLQRIISSETQGEGKSIPIEKGAINCNTLSAHTHPSKRDPGQINPPSSSDLESLWKSLKVRCKSDFGFLSHLVFSHEGVFVITPKRDLLNFFKLEKDVDTTTNFIEWFWHDAFEFIDTLTNGYETDKTKSYIDFQTYQELLDGMGVIVTFTEWELVQSGSLLEIYTFDKRAS